MPLLIKIRAGALDEGGRKKADNHGFGVRIFILFVDLNIFLKCVISIHIFSRLHFGSVLSFVTYPVEGP